MVDILRLPCGDDVAEALDSDTVAWVWRCVAADETRTLPCACLRHRA